MESKVLPKTTEVEFAGKTVVLRKLTLGKYAELSRMISSLGTAVDLEAFSSEDTAKIMKSVLTLLETAPEKIAEIGELISGVEKQILLDSEAEEVIDLIVAGWKLNNVIALFKDTAKKVMGA